MNNDIVTRLRGCWCGDGFANRGLVDPACDHDGVRADAADEIQRLRALAEALYEETKRCGSKHDVKATNDWEEYEQGLRYE